MLKIMGKKIFTIFVNQYFFLYFQRSPSQGITFSQQDDAQSTRSGDTPVTSQSNTNSSHNADNNSEIGKYSFRFSFNP